MLERAKNTVLISCLSVLSVISRFTFTAFLMVTLCFAATSAPPVKASDQPRQPAQAGTAQTNQSPTGQSPTVPNEPATVFGYRDFSKQRQWDHIFLGVPSPARAEQHLKILT